MLTIRGAWGTEGGLVLPIPFGVRTAYIQLRDPAAPWAKDVRVRRALVHSTDRQGMSDGLYSGFTTPADTYPPLDSPEYRRMSASGFPRYPYDPSRAQQLMGEAGWRTGADGILNDEGGLPLTLDVSATNQDTNVQEVAALANIWQKTGFQATPAPLAANAANLDQLKNSVRGAFVWPGPSFANPSALASSQIASERTGWKGSNYSGYSSPAVDDFYRRFQVTLDTPERQQVLADLMRVVAEEVPVIPLYYYGNGVVARKGVTGPATISPLQTANLWNIHEWDVR